MDTVEVLRSEFVGGALAVDGLPPPGVPEIAFIGRSNSGKSSLINRLLGRHRLAHTSKTPGRTQEINLYDVMLRIGERRLPLRFADLPGFGYAKFSKAQRRATVAATERYLVSREPLKAVCLLMDSKRLPKDEERAVQELAFDSGRSLIVIATKVDRLSQRDRAVQQRTIAEAFGLESHDILLSGEDSPPGKLWSRILLVTGEES